VSLEEGDAKARELAVNFIETSAKAGFNIKVGRRGAGWGGGKRFPYVLRSGRGRLVQPMAHRAG
jgi:hypothetical protein